MAENEFGILDRVREAALEPCALPSADRGVGEWMDLIAEVSAAIAVLAAARDAAVVRLAAIEEVVTEDGVIGEQVNGLGTVCVDAAAMVSTAAGVTTRFGQDLVEGAVLRVVRVPQLHAAMAAGVLDEYRARCIGGELEGVPPDVARTVVDALGIEIESPSGPALRRRAREILSRLAPELLRERIRKARASAGMRRWSGEPGTQCWSGVFPSERSARAWAAVDALARKYRAEELYPTLEQARAYALLDLVDGRTSVETVLHVTVSADALNEARGADASGCHHADCGSTNDQADCGSTNAHADDIDGPAGPSSPAPPSPSSAVPASAFRAAPALAGTSASTVTLASSTDSGVSSGGSSPPTSSPPTSSPPASLPPASLPPTSAVSASASPGGALVRLPAGEAECRGGERFVAVLLPGSELVAWVPVAVLPDHEATARWVCDPDTGALLDADDVLAGKAYRPGRALRRLVRQRDRRCRFPGCVVPARQCDIDHVVPWPVGQTAASNLMCLCRRHHRVKQRWRWRVRLFPDGVVEWVDPSGRRVRTYPADQLRTGQVQVTDVEAATAEDIAEQREIEALNALYAELTGEQRLDDPEDQYGHHHGHSERCGDDGPWEEGASGVDTHAVDASAAEAALAMIIIGLSRAVQPDLAAATAAAPDRPRSLGHAFDQNRIPRPSRPRGPGQRADPQCRDSQHWGALSCDSPSCDHEGSQAHRWPRRSSRPKPSPLDVSDLRARHRHLKIRYRPSRRHGRRAAYLAAGGPPF